MLTILSGAWWIAKAATVREGLSRWWNGDTAKAIAAVVIAIVLLTGGVLLFKGGGSGAIARRDFQWLRSVSTARDLIHKRAIARNEAAARAADLERQKAERERDDALRLAVELERELAALTAKDGDPIVFPRSLVRSLK